MVEAERRGWNKQSCKACCKWSSVAKPAEITLRDETTHRQSLVQAEHKAILLFSCFEINIWASKASQANDNIMLLNLHACWLACLLACLLAGLLAGCLALSNLVLSCLVLSCLVLSYLVLSCVVLFCLVLSCLVLSLPSNFKLLSNCLQMVFKMLSNCFRMAWPELVFN